MSCTLTITTAVVNGGNIIVNGTFTANPSCNPGPFSLSVKVTCASGSCGGNGGVILGSNQWEAIFPCNCPCGGPVTITAVATCTNPSFTCTATLNLPVLCCCPTASTQIIYGSCTGNNQLVSFNTFVTIPDGCTFTFRRNFGDGNFGSNYTFTGPGTFPLPLETHYYAAPSSYTTTVEVVGQPIGCNTIDSQAVVVSCSGCFSSPLLAGICRFLEWTFLVFSVAALGGFIGLPCWVIGLPVAYLAVAALALVIYLILKCQKCTCGYLPKFLGEIFFATGLIMLMYILPVCSTVNGIVAFIFFLVFTGMGVLILWNWYQANRLTCPLLICDFWCALAGIANIRSATNVALAAGLILLASSGFVLTFGFGLMAIVVAIFAFIVGMGPLNNPPCQPFTPTCQ